MTTAHSTFWRCTVVVALALSSRGAAQSRADITIHEPFAFPESVTSARDGSVFFGGFDKGNIYRAAPGASTAEVWQRPSTGNLQTLLGVLADDASRTLWVCAALNVAAGAQPPAVRDSALLALDLSTGANKKVYPFPGGGLCNDIAVAPDGTAYVTDTLPGRVLRLKKGAAALDVWSTDPLLASADGIALLADGAVYVNTVRTGTLVRISVNNDGSAGPVVKLELSRALVRPDGMRAVSRSTLILTEGEGRLDEVTISDNTASVRVLREGLEQPTAVTLVDNTAIVLEAKLFYRNDLARRGQDPGPFRGIVVPYRPPK